MADSRLNGIRVHQIANGRGQSEILTPKAARVRVFRLFQRSNRHYYRTDEAVIAAIIG
jgi:hypothetical protein